MISVGVIGLGYWGPNLVRNVASSGRTRLAAICDRAAARVEKVGAQFPAAKRCSEPEELYSDPSIDAVVIATPVSTHAPLGIAALRAGKHVLVEKPMTASVEDAEALVREAEKARRVLVVDHVFVHHPAVMKIRDLLASGELGEPYFFDSVRINLGLFQHDVDVVWDLAPHDVSMIDHMVQRLPKAVTCVGASHAGNGLADVAYLHMDYGGGLIATVHVNWLSPVKIRRFMVGGTRRSVVYDDLDPSERVKVYDRGIDVSHDPERVRQVLVSYRSGDVLSPRIDSTEALSNLVRHFADRIEKDVRPLSGGDEGLRVVRVLDAARRSLAAGGARVEV